MKRILYSGITKTLMALLLLASCTITAHYAFLTLRAPVLDGSAKTVYETKQYSELFSKYVERTAVYVRYLEDGYSLIPSALDSELALLLEGEITDIDLEDALFNVYEPSDTAFYYYHSKLNEEPTNFQYYVKNTETDTFYCSAAFIKYAEEKSGSVDNFLSSGILNENIYVILNTGNNRTMTGGGNSRVLNRSNLLWSMDFLRRPLSEMAEDARFKFNYNLAVESEESDNATDTDYLESVSNSGVATEYPDTGAEDYELRTDGSSPLLKPLLPPKGSYLVYALVADNLVTDEFTNLSESFTDARSDFNNGLQFTVIFTLLSVFLFTLCNIVSGRQADSPEIHLHFYDRIYTELILGGLIFLFFLPYILWECALQPYLNTTLNNFVAFYPQYRQWVSVFLGCLILYLFVTGLLYFSLIRRIKAKTFLSSSFLGRYILLPLGKLLRTVWKNLTEFFSNLPSLWKTILNLGLAAVWLIISVFFLLCEPVELGILILFLGGCYCAFVCLRNMLDHARITQSTAQMSVGNLSARIPTESMLPSNKSLSEDINHICDGLHYAVEEQTKSERMKTELITNVSHDIKTPLTSIINYIELLKNELPKEGTLSEYAEILSQKSWRLKALIDDLVEASKAASGTMKLDLIRFNAVELLRQAVGDFEERLTGQNLTLCMTLPETPVNVLADGACTHRIIENMLSNVCKYALNGTRVFVSLDLPEGTGLALLTIKNTSAAILSKTPEELLTRFSRGDEARSDEGSGLGLSIAESLAALQGGSFYIETDGDLFKAKLTIPLAD